MVRKNLRVSKTIKAVTQTAERQKSTYKRNKGVYAQNRIDMCLDCKKASSECKGDCK